MPCPFATLTALGAVVGASRALFMEDRDARWIARVGLVALLAGWVAYYATGRHPGARVGLEIVSVLALVAAALRVHWLVRRAGPTVMVPPRALAWSRRWAHVAWTPTVMIAKAWLLVMLVLEWTGRVHFDALEYVLVCALIVGLLAWRVVRARRSMRFDALESYADRPAGDACPAGFGSDGQRGFGMPARAHAAREDAQLGAGEGGRS